MMACATLKRSLDWDSLNQRPSKRRRFHPFGSPSSSPSTSQNAKILEPAPSPFAEASNSNPKLTPGNLSFI